MKKIILASVAILAVSPTLALAKDGHEHRSAGVQYQGPVELSNVDTLLADTSMFTEKNVVVEGVLVRQIKDDTFIFSDGKGEIQVELDDDIHMAQPINEKTKVRLFGEYEGGTPPEIEVEHIQIL